MTQHTDRISGPVLHSRPSRPIGTPAPHAPATARGTPNPAARPPAALREAAELVAATWSERLAESVNATEIHAVTSWLIEAIELTELEDTLPPPPAASTLARFLLERLSVTVLPILEQDERITKAESMRVLRGIERARTRLAPDWERYFASQIEGPDGLNLVTEILHDLRSPLTSIRCLAEILERGQSGPVNDIQRRQLRLIYSASLGLSTMASDVLEMARRREQLVDPDPVPFSVAEVFESIEAMVRPTAEEKGLYVKFGTLPSDLRVGKPVALGRLLLNLVTNALKFTDEGGVEVRVRSTGLTKVEFTIVDTGPGIPAAAISTLFQPFRRSSVHRERSDYMFSGTGLGLALCRKLLRAMGSELRLETKIGEGTAFSFELDLPRTTTL